MDNATNEKTVRHGEDIYCTYDVSGEGHVNNVRFKRVEDIHAAVRDHLMSLGTEDEPFIDEYFALDKSNGSARMGLFYHDFGGDGPAIHRFGVGAAIVGDCTEIWWVIQFAP